MTEWHVMFDLETLGIDRTAMVNELGWAVFDPYEATIATAGNTFLRLDEQQALKRTIDYGTFQWWLQQGEDARRMMGTPHEYRISVYTLWDYLEENIAWSTITGVWSHGLTFDIPIIEHLLAQTGPKKVPWSYKITRDTRTLFALIGCDTATLKNTHSAKEDAINQAEWVQRAYKTLRQWRENNGVYIRTA